MNNDVIAEAISGLATAIRLLGINDQSSQAAARVEGIIQSARLEEQQFVADSFQALLSARASRAAGGIISKSALEDEMQRREVLRDTPPGTA